jgi:hypothetical protein
LLPVEQIKYKLVNVQPAKAVIVKYAKAKRADRHRFCRFITTYENNTSELWKR